MITTPKWPLLANQWCKFPVFPGDLKVEWAHGWTAWDEFQSSAQLQQIMDRANQVLKKQGKGTGKSKSKDAGAAAYTAF